MQHQNLILVNAMGMDARVMSEASAAVKQCERLNRPRSALSGGSASPSTAFVNNEGLRFMASPRPDTTSGSKAAFATSLSSEDSSLVHSRGGSVARCARPTS